MTVCMIDITLKKETASIGRPCRPMSVEPDESTDCVALIPARTSDRKIFAYDVPDSISLPTRVRCDARDFGVRSNNMQTNRLVRLASCPIGADALRGERAPLRFVNGDDNRRFDRFTVNGVRSCRAA